MDSVWTKQAPERVDLTKYSWVRGERERESVLPETTRGACVLFVHFKREQEGVTVTCPDIDLAMCGKSENEVWLRFVDAFNDLKEFLNENESELAPDLKERLAILRDLTVFHFVREP